MGAAIATAISYFVFNILVSLRLFRKARIHPFNLNYIKCLVIGFVLIFLFQFFNLGTFNSWNSIPIIISFIFIYYILILFSKIFDNEDVKLFLALEKKIGFKLVIIKKILKKFL